MNHLLVDPDVPLGRRVLGLPRTVELALELACVLRLPRLDRQDETDAIHGRASPLRAQDPNNSRSFWEEVQDAIHEDDQVALAGSSKDETKGP